MRSADDVAGNEENTRMCAQFLEYEYEWGENKEEQLDAVHVNRMEMGWDVGFESEREYSG